MECIWKGFKEANNSQEKLVNNVGQLNCFNVQFEINNIKLYMKDLICVDFSKLCTIDLITTNCHCSIACTFAFTCKR